MRRFDALLTASGIESRRLGEMLADRAADLADVLNISRSAAEDWIAASLVGEYAPLSDHGPHLTEKRVVDHCKGNVSAGNKISVRAGLILSDIGRMTSRW